MGTAAESFAFKGAPDASQTQVDRRLQAPAGRAESRDVRVPATRPGRRAADVRVQRLREQLVSIQEGERRRIGRDLHDVVGQRVTTLRVTIESLKHLDAPADWRKHIDHLLGLIDTIDRDLDVVVCELRPAVLDESGLAGALDLLVLEWSHLCGIPASFDARGPTRRLPADIEHCLYRIAQEALNNILKHARATRAAVRLEWRAGGVLLAVDDDGCGFDLSECSRRDPRARGIGLMAMQERAALVHGRVEFETKPGGGTSVLVRIPSSSDRGQRS